MLEGQFQSFAFLPGSTESRTWSRCIAHSFEDPSSSSPSGRRGRKFRTPGLWTALTDTTSGETIDSIDRAIITDRRRGHTPITAKRILFMREGSSLHESKTHDTQQAPTGRCTSAGTSFDVRRPNRSIDRRFSVCPPRESARTLTSTHPAKAKKECVAGRDWEVTIRLFSYFFFLHPSLLSDGH